MSFSVSGTLERMANVDKDFRYMAASDLNTELEKESFKLDPSSEQRLVPALLKLLKDTSNPVQELAIKCLGTISRKAKESSVNEILDFTYDGIVNEKTEDLRDIHCMALKAAISNAPLDNATTLASIQKRLLPKLIQLINSTSPNEVKAYALDALTEVVAKLGKSAAVDPVLECVLPQLKASASILRKRAIACVSILAFALPDTLFPRLVDRICELLNDPAAKADHVKAGVQCAAAIATSAGPRLGKNMGQLVPTISKSCENPKFNQDDELREHCFLAFEAISLRCPKEAAAFTKDILALCLKYIKYDPNYAGEEDEEEDEGEPMETDEGEEEEEDAGDYSDDDDMSWKVRRAAAKALSALVATRPDMLEEMHTKVAPVLIQRFKEREESVKLDIFRTFTDLIKQTGAVTGSKSTILVTPQIAQRVSSLALASVPKVVAAAAKQLKEKSLKNRAGAFGVLNELVAVFPGSLAAQAGELIPAIIVSLGDKSGNTGLKVEALSFVRALLSSHQPQVFASHVTELVQHIVKCVADPYFRISSEALRVTSELVRVLAASSPQVCEQQAPALYKATMEQLRKADSDQEVKECALLSLGALISMLPSTSVPAAELSAAVQLLLDRLRNESTRLTAAKVIARVASADGKPEHLTKIVPELSTELASLLRKANRQLRQSALTALSAIVESSKGAPLNFQAIASELALLITDADLFLAHLSLLLTVQILRCGPSAASALPIIQDKVLQAALDITRSSLLQGIALQSLLSLFSELSCQTSKSLTAESLIEQLLHRVESAPSKQSVSSVAQCIAAITAAPDKKTQRDNAVSKFVKDIQKSKDDVQRVVALSCVAEIGRRSSLGAFDGLPSTIFSAFESPSEDVRQSASYALGCITVGCMEKFLSFVLDQITSNPARQYLLLHSLREIIVRQSSDEGVKALRPYLVPVLRLLFSHCEAEEEGTRSVVSECLGRIALAFPTDVIPEIEARLGSKNPHARSTAISALKYAVVDNDHPVDDLISPRIHKFMSLLADQDLSVRRSALVAVNFVAHHKAKLIRAVLGEYLPCIFIETKVRPELIREIDLGPFKHKVDDGLEVRKSAFECIYTLLEVGSVDVMKLAVPLAQGLVDHYDVKLLCHLILVRLAAVAGPLMLEAIDSLVDPLRETVIAKAKDTAVKQEVERNDELVRSALRAVAALAKIPGADSIPKFRDFMRATVLSTEFVEKYKEITKEDVSSSDYSSYDKMDTSM